MYVDLVEEAVYLGVGGAAIEIGNEGFLVARLRILIIAALVLLAIEEPSKALGACVLLLPLTNCGFFSFLFERLLPVGAGT